MAIEAHKQHPAGITKLLCITKWFKIRARLGRSETFRILDVEE